MAVAYQVFEKKTAIKRVNKKHLIKADSQNPGGRLFHLAGWGMAAPSCTKTNEVGGLNNGNYIIGFTVCNVKPLPNLSFFQPSMREVVENGISNSIRKHKSLFGYLNT